MTPSPDRACPSCSAPARDDQHWCLECGAELPEPGARAGRRPAIGIATTLLVLVGAASAGGYSLMQDGAKPPPPPTTVAQEVPPTVTSPVTPAPAVPDVVPPTGGDDTALPDLGPDDPSGGTSGGVGGGGSSSSGADAFGDAGGGGGTSASDPDATAEGGGSVEDEPADDPDARARRPSRARLVETNVALGAVAVAYPPLTDDTIAGDPSALVDGSTRTAWRTPRYEDPATSPQVGVYVDLAAAERLRGLVVNSPTRGARVEVYAARSGPPPTVTAGGWDHVADLTLAPRAAIDLPSRTRYRYVLLWVTGLPAGGEEAAISEVEILSMQPE